VFVYLHGGVAVQLHVLALQPEKLEQAVGNLVLADTLVPNQQKILLPHLYEQKIEK
jgi:hypothetical protein